MFIVIQIRFIYIPTIRGLGTASEALLHFIDSRASAAALFVVVVGVSACVRTDRYSSERTGWLQLSIRGATILLSLLLKVLFRLQPLTLGKSTLKLPPERVCELVEKVSGLTGSRGRAVCANNDTYPADCWLAPRLQVANGARPMFGRWKTLSEYS